MSRETAGPWSVVEHSWSDVSVVSAERTICTLSILDEATEETQDELEKRDGEVARLIAAAPEMRDLLQSISNWLVCEAIATPEDMAQSFSSYRAEIDALIAKLSA